MDDCMSMDTGTDQDTGDDRASVSFEADGDSSSYDDTSWNHTDSGHDATSWDEDTSGHDEVPTTVEVASDQGAGDAGGCGGSGDTLGVPDLPHEDTLAAAPVAMESVATTPATLGTEAPLVPLPGQVAAAPGTASGFGTPTSWDASGAPTHVSYSGVINPPTESVTIGGNSLYAGLAPVDPTHVTLDYVPQQIPRTDGLGPSPATSNPQVLALQGLIAQTNTDMITNTLTGVSVDRSGASPTYYGAGKPFDDFGDALGAERGH